MRSAAPTLLLLAAVAGFTEAGHASASPRIASLLESAREALELEDDLHRDFRFRLARCRADGNVLLLFEQYGTFSEGLAVTMSAQTSDRALDWALGFARVDPETDPEIRAFFSDAREVPCQ